MRNYKIGENVVTGDDPAFQGLLAYAHGTRVRPLCLCKPTGVEMYVAKIANQFVIKRMPDSGSQHDPDCESYEPPPELSGLGQVLGSAIQENPEDGTTALKLDFSLSKSPGRKAPAASESEADTVRTDGNKLTIRAMLHMMFDDAGLTRWTPAMQRWTPEKPGKRSWYVIRKNLLQAAENKTTKGLGLGSLLYIPESWRSEYQEEIKARRSVAMREIEASTPSAPRKLKIVVGEVKDIAKTRTGYKVILKHCPDYHFFMADDLYKRMTKRFGFELEVSEMYDETHLMLIGTFGVSSNGIASLETLSLMLTTADWLPVENLNEKNLVESLVQDERKFTKGLRYNLQNDRPLACAVLTDAEQGPTALYIQPSGAPDEFKMMLEEMQADSALKSWVWDADSAMPPLPAKLQGK